ncbi:MAG: serine O-acetyltransferase EpsC [Crocinitomicaceae bacterium]
MKYYNLRIKREIEALTEDLFYGLFEVEVEKEYHYDEVKANFAQITKKLKIENGEKIWDAFFPQLDEVRLKLDRDAEAIEANDPAAKSLEEVYMAYPGFQAISIYRIAHVLYQLNVPILPRMMTEYAHSVTGTDIHPGAEIGDYFFIDHATGTVIGETVVIKNNVKIYQGVTLGAFHISKGLLGTKRHPTVEDNVVIYANATILGGNTTIGANSTIGANVWITESIPANSNVIHKYENIIKTKNVAS